MRSILLTCASLALFGLAACGEGAVREEAAPEAAADAAAVDNALSADGGGAAAAPGDSAAATGALGTTGTAPPDGSGKPGTTLPTLPPGSAEATGASTPGSASN